MEKDKVRKPAVAGSFYPSPKTNLEKAVQSLLDFKAKPEDALACILPHAGYMYSGMVAGHTLSRMIIKDSILLLGPNHTGTGPSFSIMTEGSWQTPLGEVEINGDLGNQLLQRSRYLEEDCLAHKNEHSLEVQLPFLQYLKKDFQIVPIVILDEGLASLQGLGQELGEVIRASGWFNRITIIASSDLTHYEPEDEARRKDNAAIQATLELNEEKLMEKIQELRISMCGWAPVITMLCAAKLLGAHSAELIKYSTSGDTTGDYTSVVGYAGIIVH